MDSFLKKVKDSINFANFDHILVGFSGGADSTALLYSLKQISKEMPFNLRAVHFEHGIRGETSLNDLKWAKDFCYQNEISFSSFNLDVLSNIRKGEGIEEAARRLRLEEWFKLAKQIKTAIALGQHLDDKIENFFIRLLRGSNASGLTSLKSSVFIKNVQFIRPLINCSKNEVITFLSKSGITFVTDETNHESVYRRNIIRNGLLPEIYEKFPNSKKALTASINAISADADFIDLTAKNEFSKIKNSEYIDLDFLKNLHDAVLIRVLRLWLSMSLKEEYVPSLSFFKRVKKALSLIDLTSEKLIPLTGIEFYISIKNNKFSIKNKLTKQQSNKTIIWNWKENSVIRYGNYELTAQILKKDFNIKSLNNRNEFFVFDTENLPQALYLRRKKDGDRLTPFGSDKNIRLKKILKNKKIDTEARIELPILTMPDDKILWVPYTIRSNFAAIKDTTSEITLFEISQVEF